MEKKQKIFDFSNLAKMSAWKRVFKLDNLINLLAGMVFLFVGLYDRFLGDNCLYFGTIVMIVGLVLFLIMLFCIVCSTSEERLCLWDFNSINKVAKN